MAVTDLTPFPVDPVLSGVTLAYRNNRLIADEVLPRIPEAYSFRWNSYALEDMFQIVDAKVDRRGKPTEIELPSTEQTSSMLDYALDDRIPQRDIDLGQVQGRSIVAEAVEWLSSLIALAREKRVADLLSATATYPAGNRATLSGQTQWSDYTNSNPVSAIKLALDIPVMRPNIGIFGRAAWTKVSMHPKVVEAVGGNAVRSAGVVPYQAFADLLELDEIYVGEGWYNTAKRGQTATMSRLWGKMACFLYRDRLANAQRGITFGYTAEYGTRRAGSSQDEDIGALGGQRARVIEQLKEVVCAADLGYLFDSVVA